jgi:hypothetical protein
MTKAGVTGILNELDTAWRRDGVPAAWRRTLAADVEPDLHAAAEDGADPADLLQPDPATFAHTVADAAGVSRVRPELGRSAAGFLAGATLAFFLGWLPTVAVLTETSSVSSEDPLTASTLALFAATFGVLGLLCLFAGLAALAGALNGRERVRQTVVRTALVLPVLAFAVVPTVISFARATDYSTSTPVVLTELIVVYGAAAAGVVLGRIWALRGALD